MKGDDNDCNIIALQSTTKRKRQPTKRAAKSSPKKKQRTTKPTKAKATRKARTKRGGNSARSEDSDEEYEP
jgi:hypothetical protein